MKKIFFEKLFEYNFERTNTGDIILNHVTFPERVEELLKYGFRPSKSGSNKGNVYGPGIYTTFNLKSSMFNLDLYGGYILRLKLNSLDKILLVDTVVAKDFYGFKLENVDENIKEMYYNYLSSGRLSDEDRQHFPWLITEQLSKFIPGFRHSDEFYDLILTEIEQEISYIESTKRGLKHFSGVANKEVLKTVGYDSIVKFLNGILFHGTHDGYVMLLYNFFCAEIYEGGLGEDIMKGKGWDKLDVMYDKIERAKVSYKLSSYVNSLINSKMPVKKEDLYNKFHKNDVDLFFKYY